MNDFKQTLHALTLQFPSISEDTINTILTTYQSLTELDKNITIHIQNLSKQFPQLFKMYGDVRAVPQFAKTIEQSDIDMALSNPLISKVKQQLLDSLDQTKYIWSERIKDRQQLLKNSFINPGWGHTDLVGMRIVPRKTKDFLSLVILFDQIFGQTISFTKNFFIQDHKDHSPIRTSSPHYFGINYHFPIPPFFFEIQIRPSAINLWADLNHDTVYKKLIPIDKKAEQALNQFGEVCAVVDLYEMSSSTLTVPPVGIEPTIAA